MILTKRMRPTSAFAAIEKIPPIRIINKRLPFADARRANPENPIIQQILILTNCISPKTASATVWIPAFTGMTGRKTDH